jgi:hypothetical protein
MFFGSSYKKLMCLHEPLPFYGIIPSRPISRGPRAQRSNDSSMLGRALTCVLL